MKCKLLFLGAFLLTIGLSAQTTLMTYNLRYANETDGENSWSNRKEMLTGLIGFHHPDIFGVQEALHKQIEYILHKDSDYDFVGIGRDDGKEAGEYSAIFYDTNKFRVLKNNTFWLSKTPKKPSMGWDAAYKRICTYALFKNTKTNQKFYVFNTHLDNVGKNARKNGVALILKKILKINQKGLPVVLTGDFNSQPTELPIKKITSAFLHDSKIEAETTYGPSGTFNNYSFKKPVKRRIDYIFVSSAVDVKKYAVLSDNKDTRYPSDHLPVWVAVEFK